jgi:hypothetical protein
LALVFYVDDWDAFSRESKQAGTGFNLDSAQNKFALQIGVAWSPSYRVFRKVSLDYLMITPYTYTHNAESSVPYLSYTHLGKSLGSILEPNSDQITLKVFLTPAEWMDLDLLTRFMRHGNASEEYDRGDGTIFDDGFYDAGTVTFYGPSRFLTQSVIEIVFQTGFDLGFHFPLGWSELSIGLGYLFEYTWNRNLVSGRNGTENFLNLSVELKL